MEAVGTLVGWGEESWKRKEITGAIFHGRRGGFPQRGKRFSVEEAKGDGSGRGFSGMDGKLHARQKSTNGDRWKRRGGLGGHDWSTPGVIGLHDIYERSASGRRGGRIGKEPLLFRRC